MDFHKPIVGQQMYGQEIGEGGGRGRVETLYIGRYSVIWSYLAGNSWNNLDPHRTSSNFQWICFINQAWRIKSLPCTMHSLNFNCHLKMLFSPLCTSVLP